jgi:serine/threonine protein phosphatase PrpC
MIDGNFEILSAAVTDRGLSEKRPQNEDSYLSLPEHGIFAVADGVGGAMAGDVASQMAVEILGEAFINYSSTADPEEIMTVAIDRANTAINQMASELPQLSSMATTIVALHVSGNFATIAHVGDSRLYRLDADGNLYRETQDHSVVEEEVRAGRMTPEQAVNHPSRNVISRAVGAETTVDIDIKTIILEPGTIFLICSDGITRHIPDQEIAELLTTGMSLPMLCEQMKEICYSRGAEDNLTAILVKAV